MENVRREVKELIDFCRSKLQMSENEINRVQQAYDFACEAHCEQKRKSGEPFISHPVAVATIVTMEFNLGVDAICAAFLHDVIEDTPHNQEDISKLFGESVAMLVQAVTKNKKENYEVSLQVDTFKHMLGSIDYDIRALMIKLADRLHNMRTLDNMPSYKQVKIAAETDYFYAGLANRLGLYDVKKELEDLSLRYRTPLEYQQLQEYLEKDYENSQESIEAFKQEVEHILQNNKIDAHVLVERRPVCSIYRRINEKGMDASQVKHKHFFSIVYNSSVETEKVRALEIYSVLTDHIKDKPKTFKNYINAPKENGYQSLHVDLLNQTSGWEEVHIASSRMMTKHHRGCLTERNNNSETWVERFRKQLQDIAYHGITGNYMEHVTTNLYNDDIYILTPRGDIRTLPKDSTVLDLAFDIHTHVGLKAKYAHVNGELASVKRALLRGDIVDIHVNETACVKADWLDHARTYKARQKISRYLHKQADLLQPDFELCPHCSPIPGEEVVAFKLPDHAKLEVHRRACTKAISKAAQAGDTIVDYKLESHPDSLYPISLQLVAGNSKHLLADIIKMISTVHGLNMDKAHVVSEDEIVTCHIDFSVHSVDELNDIISYLRKLPEVEIVKRIAK